MAKQDPKELMQEYGKLLLKRLDLVTISVVTALLITVSYMVLLQEGSWTVETPEAPAPKPWREALPGPEVEALRRTFPAQATPLAQDDKLRVLVQNDMFTLRAARESGDARGRFNEEYRQAEALYLAGQREQALAIVERILAQDPTNASARDLRTRLGGGAPAPPATPVPGAR